ncbi:hypothetical protein Bca4012_039307 [Brassica carinata]
MAKAVYKKFNWVIKEFSLQSEKCYSVPVLISDCKCPEETADLLECQEGNQAADASARNSQEDSTCQEVQNSENAASQEKLDYNVSQNIPCVDASKEGLDVDGASEEGSDDDGPKEGKIDDDASSLVTEDGSMLKGPLNQSNSLKDGSSLTVGNCGMRCDNVVSETEVSNVDYDDAAIDAVTENEQGDGNASSQRGEDIDDMKCNKVASVTEASNDILKEVQPIKETKDVNGFQFLSSQVELVNHIFKRHPDIALCFRPKNKEIRRAYMNELLSLIDMLCQSPEKLSEDDLSNADDTLADLIDVGFKLDWLKIKLNEVSEKKKKEKGSGARLQTMEEQLQKLKLMFVDLETQVQMEKAEALAARATLSFNDVTNDLLKNTSPGSSANGSKQVESVSHIFKRHPDIALGFRPKNQEIRRAYMNELLSLIDMLCQSPEKLSDDTLADLIDVGFKLDWLKIKLNEVTEKKKKKEQISGDRLQTMEEQLQRLKLMFLNLETQLEKEKEQALAARAPLSFNDRNHGEAFKKEDHLGD